MNNKDTIIAQATPIGRGGIGIIRISGLNAKKVAYSVLKKIPKPRYANYLPFYDYNNNILDKGIALWFPKPNSFTGEDVLELHGHGGFININLLIENILKKNKIRIAKPGEFLKRAFINNKIDLIQAEAISDLINANSILSTKLAISSFKGNFSIKINNLIKLINNLRINLEMQINFSENNNNNNNNNNIFKKEKIKKYLNNIINIINSILNKTNTSNTIKEAINVIILGLPNVGKSSLINILSNEEISIINKLSGTTRDILSKYIQFDNIQLNIIDTAGLRKTKNKIEKIGIKKTINEIKKANHLLFLTNSKKKKSFLNLKYNFIKKIPHNLLITVIRNKIDLTKELPGIFFLKNYTLICLSLLKLNGIDLLKKYLKKKISLNNNFTEGIFLSRLRHLELLKKAKYYLLKSKIKLKNVFYKELLAEDLKLANNELNKITGKKFKKNIINEIFSKFCIGK
ncbi:tRNA uridine-5-carboxymethylaminomethyl(34) synthesis GTPase MnmE [Enterobacteriaceae bacterium ET-AT1-13]|nr:tRNA uridine-5-carboxymethylaminomethyl(34) synthesis GTPase MnmE [Enterobacteriaceae bacterium ET-AT1-13]WGS66452.1 tRNA uridine-5-carboxymethylaminomethyl(34) synthesis GTPase MnmE [Enterobacteriaceae bacterium Cmel17]WMC17684.1 MAG: tRNA uridine-5-carboxymethylaminomethyl(34) synthesis GTPase MnmE [Enterobacteriaceae bacterium PSmelAO3-2]WMC18091.1 MAG: tRNA uridine-5-carboxymethylaminomethyl(34) synthesis GTPase MnmE [Enterobacteriaceae bacterium PSmelAO1]